MSAAPGPLHVAVGVLAGVTGGPASYGRQLVAALARSTDPVRVTVLTDRPESFAGIGCEIVHLPMRGGLARLPWQHLQVPRALRRVGPDVYHDTKNALPIGLRLPAVVTVHDLAYHTVPETFGFASRLFLRRATAHAVRVARAVVVPSQATADDLARIHPHAAPKIHVVPHGIAQAPRPDDATIRGVRERLRLPERYVLHVGTIQARKNVHLLIDAVRSLRAKHTDLRVVLVGRRGWLADKALAEIARDDTAQWLGALPDSDLAAVYAGAAAFASPSAYEGFGFTVGDALAAGVPTVVSNVSSLPEVCGDAALRLERIDVASIATAIERLLSEPGLSARLRRAGPARAASFTWERAAAGHVAAYRAAVSSRAPR
ncbi:MAG: glycosyltransferase family 1 protein [Planctomycetota bacterium]